MQKIIVVCALKDEFVNQNKYPVEVIYTGLGKINATYHTTKAIFDFAPKLIINVGTAGSINHSQHGLVEVTKVIQRDMLTEPLAPRGITPFSIDPNLYFSHAKQHKNIICGTGDSFVTSEDPWLIENKIDIVDMELYAIALVAYKCNIPWRAFKFISDNADSEAGDTWQQHIDKGNELFNAAIEQVFQLPIED